MKSNKSSIFLIILFNLFFWNIAAIAQTNKASSLKNKLLELKKNENYLNDTTYLNTVNQLAFYYASNYPDSAIGILNGNAAQCKKSKYAIGEAEANKNLGLAYQTKGDYEKGVTYLEIALQIAVRNNLKKLIPAIINNIGLNYSNRGNYAIALQKFYEGLEAAEADDNKFVTGRIYNNIGTIHFFQVKMVDAEADYKKMLSVSLQLNDTPGIILAYNNIGEVNLHEKHLDTAQLNFYAANKLALISNNAAMQAAANKNLGFVFYEMDSLDKSIAYFTKAYQLALSIGNKPTVCKTLIGLAKAQSKNKQYAEAIKNALEAVQLAETMKQSQLLRDANEVAAMAYEADGNNERAIFYLKKYKLYSDSLNNFESERASSQLKANFDLAKKESQLKEKSIQQRWIIFSAIAALSTLFVIVWVVNRNRKRVKNANILLLQKNNAIEKQKLIAEDALHQLKATERQLIQSEKMASLGELTAGIAHEIQNPLNFVNNFSEVSAELIKEMVDEVDKGNTEEVKAIANDVVQNLEKINHHGNRAADIIKSMLQHSRSNSGVKEPTDINALADEYLRLAYHGLRAKDKSFNATMKTDFDETIGNINIIPQDIGRVILNLITNAFYVVNEKSKQVIAGYEPTVSVTTTKANGNVEINVTDNGNGIPQKILNKIFQPFFTTKPTGQGTGLGLSLSYDIVKAHGGELKVETKENEGSTFTIQIPMA